MGDKNEVRKLTQQRYGQLYSLQLALDSDGNFAKLPESVEDVYQQRIPVSKTPLTNSTYQNVPSAPAPTPSATAVATPVAIEPGIQRQVVQQPVQQVEKSRNTVTTTTLRPKS